VPALKYAPSGCSLDGAPCPNLNADAANVHADPGADPDARRAAFASS